MVRLLSSFLSMFYFKNSFLNVLPSVGEGVGDAVVGTGVGDAVVGAGDGGEVVGAGVGLGVGDTVGLSGAA